MDGLNGVVPVDELIDGVLIMHAVGLDRGLRLGWKDLDEHYRVRCGDLNVVTGIPGNGKSEFMDAVMMSLATLHDWRFLIFSPENHPAARHYVKLLEKYLRKPFMPGHTPNITLQDIVSAKEWMTDHFKFMCPGEEDMNLGGIYRIIDHVQTVMQIDGFILDPWNEISHARKDGQSETDYVAAALGYMRRKARQWKMATWLVAHPTKLQKGPNGAYPVPTPYDISGSAHFRNRADNCLAVHRHDPNVDVCEIHIQKIKQKEVGKCGTVQLRYDKTTGCFSDYI